jgi:hypothetical protein
VYSFNECVIEKFRAKHDRVNPALAGCATGAMLAYSGKSSEGHFEKCLILRGSRKDIESLLVSLLRSLS